MAERLNPVKGQKSDKLWRDALRVACFRRFSGGPENKKYLTKIAEMVVKAAAKGDLQAAKEIGDRLDGRPAQAIVGANDGPIQVETAVSDRELARRIALILGQAVHAPAGQGVVGLADPMPGPDTMH